MIIKSQWESFASAVLPPNCSQIQRDEMRKAFYAGAMALFTGIMGMLEPGEDATPADLLKMDDLDQELKDFYKSL